MRLNWLSCGVAALSLTATLVVAQPPKDGDRPGGDRRGGDRPDGEREVPPMVKALDTNADGKITAEELKNATKALMALDGNGDGVLTEEEYGRPRGSRGGPGGGPGDFLAQFDKDGDGKISKEEAPERMRENFEKMDVNGDGLLDQSDFEAMRERFRQGGGPGGQGDMASRMKEMDKNGDGKISKEEAPDRMKENFDQIDTNKDGQIDEAEIRQMFERFRGQGGGRPDGDRPGGGRPDGDRPERPKAEFE